MASRQDLHDRLTEILGSRNVYFQPPASVKMSYPAIRYSLTSRETDLADNEIYSITNQYSIVVIDKNPDSDIPVKLLKALKARHTNRYTADNLYHDVFTLKY